MLFRNLLCIVLLGAGAAPSGQPSSRYLYVGVPGSDLDTVNDGVGVLVFDIGHDHRFVKRMAIWTRDLTPEGVRGLELAPPDATGGARPKVPRFYVSTTRRLAAIELLSGKVLWEASYRGHCCDQLAVSPNGRLIFAPAFGSPEWYRIDSTSGALLSMVHVMGWPRGTAFARDGNLAYLSAWESRRLTVVDATSTTIRREVGPFSGYLCPFAINRKDTLVFANIDGLLGFEVGDLRTGLVLDRVQLDDYGPDQLKQYECPSHGIAFTPDEKELWVADGVGNRLRIFDATTYPPQDKSSIDLTRQPRSITFSHDGRFAYASTGDVIDVATRRIVAVLKDEEGRVVQSERMIEVDVP